VLTRKSPRSPSAATSTAYPRSPSVAARRSASSDPSSTIRILILDRARSRSPGTATTDGPIIRAWPAPASRTRELRLLEAAPLKFPQPLRREDDGEERADAERD